MLDLTYSKETVLSIFLNNQGKVSPSAAEIQKFDADLRAANEADLIRIMTELNIATDQATKSLVLFNSTVAPGDTPQEMIRAACRYFLNTRNL